MSNFSNALRNDNRNPAAGDDETDESMNLILFL